MISQIEDFFKKEQIEIFSALDFSSCKIIDENKLKRIPDFSPESIIIFAVPFYVDDNSEKNISSYAVSRDYHLYFKELFSRLTLLLKEIFPEGSFYGFADSSPINERHAAAHARLGFLGDNGLLITEKYGSYVFLGEVISDIDVSLFENTSLPCDSAAFKNQCSHCGLCKKKCPLELYGICLSELTQKKGELSRDEEEIIKKYDCIWGCDLCQEVCPHNKGISPTPIDFFHKGRINILTKALVEDISKNELKKRAWGWRGKAPLLRNLNILTT